MRLLAVLCAASALGLGQDAREWTDQGVAAYRSGKYVEAANAFQKAVEMNPSDVNARLYLATALMSEYVPGAKSPENVDAARRAETEFQDVLRLNPANKTALASLASLSYQRAQEMPDPAQKSAKLDEAAAWYQRLLGVDPGNKEAYYSLGVIDWMKWYGPYMEARAGMAMKPSDPGPLPITAIRLELASKYSGVIDDGIRQLVEALAIDPQYADAMAYLNLLIRERADLRDTPEEYRRDTAAADEWVQKALAAKGATPQSQASGAPRRIRVSGNVQQYNLVRKVDPIYPPFAKAAKIQGTVTFTATIDKSGTIQNLQLVSGHPLLVDAARSAVQQWAYKPTLLNGQPVEVITAIDVNFTLQE